MYNPYNLKNKVILITGASSGIGRETALTCSKLGATVIITGRNEARLTQTLHDLDTSYGQNHMSITTSLSTSEEIDSFVSKLPVLDGVSSNVGIAITKPIKFFKIDDLSQTMEVNAFSHALLAKTLYKKKKLNTGASYVFTASIGGTLGFSVGNGIYGMSKAALDSLMKFCAVEFATKDIRCNSVCPGMILTPMNSGEGTLSNDDYEADKEQYLLKRYGQPEEVALPIAFLLSDAASFITGHSMVIDGGRTVVR